MRSKIDHLVFATPKLKEGIEKVEDLLQVKTSPGGQHPAYGTANVLLALGQETYLEIVGPNPGLGHESLPTLFQIDQLAGSKMVTWAAKEPQLEERLAHLKTQQIDFGTIYPGKRAKADGTILAWRFTNPHHVIGDGIIPFLIDWGRTSEHPAKTAQQGCQLLDLELEHPQANAIQPILDALDIAMKIKRGSTPAIRALIASPKGEVWLE